MGVRTKTQVTTRSRVRERGRRHLDGLSTREAQLLRMRHGLAVELDDEVGDPPEGSSPELRRKVRAIEEEVLQRARGRRPHRGSSVKAKIVRSLRRR